MVNMASAGVTYMPSRTRCSVMTPLWGALIGTMERGSHALFDAHDVHARHLVVPQQIDACALPEGLERIFAFVIITEGIELTGLEGIDVILLRPQHFRREVVGQVVLALDPDAIGAHVQVLDPARGAGMHLDDTVIVVGHLALGLDVLPQRAALDAGSAQPHVLHHRRAQGHHRAFIGRIVDHPGNQVHAADRAGRGLVTHDIGVHRADIFGIQVLSGHVRAQTLPGL